MSYKSFCILCLVGALMSTEALAQTPDGWILDTRIRFEHADQEDLKAANAITGRVRLGYETPSWRDFTLLGEIEATGVVDDDDFDPYPGAEGPAGTTLITDPENLELNRLQLSYNGDSARGVIGRQRIILNNARFVGNVGWRQNEQTFDAIKVEGTLERVDVGYAFMDRTHRIFGRLADDPTQRRLNLDAHLAWASRQITRSLKLSGYALLLKVEDPGSQGMSSDTYGILANGSLMGSGESPGPLSYHLEYARQVENGNSPEGVTFGLDYWHAALGYDVGPAKLHAGWEHLGGNGQRGLSTPLATLHAFNGWADRFLTTPVNGLEDYYLGITSSKLPLKLSGAAYWHYYEADLGSGAYGQEWDLQLSRRFAHNVTVLGKVAYYNGSGNAPAGLRADVLKVILQLEWSL